MRRWLVVLTVGVALRFAAASPPPELEKAKSFLSKKKPADALKALDQAAAQSGSDLDTTLALLELRGVALSLSNKAADAKLAFQQLLSLAPQHAAPALGSAKTLQLFADAHQGLTPLSFAAAAPETVPGDVKRIAATVADDPLKLARKVQFSFRAPPATKWETSTVAVADGRAEARVDGAAVEWFASLLGERDAELARLFSDSAPHADKAPPPAQAAAPAPAPTPAPAAALAAPPSEAVVFRVTPIQVVVLPTSAGGSDQGALVSEEIARMLPSSAFKVTTPSQLAAVMGLERQKQLLGCSEEASSCVAELANALGAEVVVSSTYAKAADGVRCNVVFVSGTDGASLERVSVNATADNALFEKLDSEVSDAASRLFAARRAGARLEPGKKGFRRYAWLPGVAAVAFGVTAGVMFAMTQGAAARLMNTAGLVSNTNEAYRLANTGRITEALQYTFAGLAIVALGTAGLMATVGAPTEPRVVLAPIADNHGGGVTFAGRF